MSAGQSVRERLAEPWAWFVVAGVVLGVVSSVLVVVASDIGLVRLAVVLAIWALVIAGLVIFRMRREAQQAAGRRTFDETHAADDELQRGEIRELRQQLDRLNTALAGLVGGEVRFERLTLSPATGRTVDALPPPVLVPDPVAAQSMSSVVAESGDRLTPVGATMPIPRQRAGDAEGGDTPPEVVTVEVAAKGAGDHRTGVSVAELLATYRGSGAPVPAGRRRRAAEV